MISRRGQFFIPWFLGFFSVVNMYMLPSAEQTPRVTDVLGAALGLWLLWRFATRGVRIEPFVALSVLGAIPLLWSLYAFFSNDIPTMVLSIRWILAIPWGYALFTVAQNPRRRTSLIWGMWWGCAVDTVVLAFQSYGFLESTQKFGFAAQDASLVWVGTAFRTPGMEGHPNASTAVVSLVVPLSLYLYYTRRARMWVVIAGLGVLLAGASFSETRSPVLVSVVTIIAMFVGWSNSKRALRLAALLIYTVLPLLYLVGPPGGWERWDFSGIEANAGERLHSNIGALQVSVGHPFGLGVEAGSQALQNVIYPPVTHNAFLQLAVIYGPLLAGALALLIFALALQTFLNPRAAWGLEAALALQMFGLFFFEDHFNSPTFIILTTWVISASAVQIATASRRAIPARSTPVGGHF